MRILNRTYYSACGKGGGFAAPLPITHLPTRELLTSLKQILPGKIFCQTIDGQMLQVLNEWPIEGLDNLFAKLFHKKGGEKCLIAKATIKGERRLIVFATSESFSNQVEETLGERILTGQPKEGYYLDIFALPMYPEINA